MKAILGYHYPTGKWNVLDIMLGALSPGAEVYKRCQIDKDIFTEFVELPIDSIEMNSNKEPLIDVDVRLLPKVTTLEDSIKNTHKILSNY